MHRYMLSALLLAGVAVAQEEPAEASAVREAPKKAPKPYFWFAMWPDLIAQYDPEIDEVVRKGTLKHGLQWGKTLSHDKKQYWVITDQRKKVGVFDLETMKVTEVHDFAEEGWIIRVGSVKETPEGKWYVRIDRVKREPDHFVVKPRQYLLYDPAEKKVEKRMDDMPKAIRSGARISPDGKKWHVFSGDIKIIDPKTFKEEGKVDLTTPMFTGMGALRPYGEDFYDYENPNAYKMLFRTTDPVQKKRRLFGILEIDMNEKKVVHYEEWGPTPSFWSFRMSRDKKLAAAMGRGGGEGVSTLAVFDMTNGRKLTESYERFRPRRSLAGMSPDGTKVYVGGAGNDFLIFDRDLNRVKTVPLEADLLGGVTVLDG